MTYLFVGGSDALMIQSPISKSYIGSKDISENQKRMFAIMSKQAGDEIQIHDSNHDNDPDYEDSLPDLRISMQHKEDINLTNALLRNLHKPKNLSFV